jgi:hypothetical protein
MAALSLQIRHGDHNASKDPLTEKTIYDYVPRDLIENLNLGSSAIKSWVDTIRLCWIALSGTSAAEAKKNYLSHMREWAFYGNSLFILEVCCITEGN